MEFTGDVIIMRGLPRTTKSDLAKSLRFFASLKTDKFPGAGGILNPTILSTDDFFTKEDGSYEFDPLKLKEAHDWNFNRFKDAISKQEKFIIVDNTNIKAYHYYHYLDYAQRNSYRVSILIIPHNDVSDRELEARESNHPITRLVIKRMRDEFQWDLERQKG